MKYHNVFLLNYKQQIIDKIIQLFSLVENAYQSYRYIMVLMFMKHGYFPHISCEMKLSIHVHIYLIPIYFYIVLKTKILYFGKGVIQILGVTGKYFSSGFFKNLFYREWRSQQCLNIWLICVGKFPSYLSWKLKQDKENKAALWCWNLWGLF